MTRFIRVIITIWNPITLDFWWKYIPILRKLEFVWTKNHLFYIKSFFGSHSNISGRFHVRFLDTLYEFLFLRRFFEVKSIYRRPQNICHFQKCDSKSMIFLCSQLHNIINNIRNLEPCDSHPKKEKKSKPYLCLYVTK